jgi:hypothetical protein
LPGQRLPRPPFRCSRQSGNLLFHYPFRSVSLNKENIPASIIKTFDEAVTCHAQNCFVASAIMIRRTLEEICEERGMDELRLLGEDAAHIEADTFTQISSQELDVAIEFTIEFLKALYQYSSLLSKMRELKKNIPKQDELT